MDDVVETSDPEELEELRRARSHLKSPQIRLSQTDDRQSPRKRAKHDHAYTDPSFRTPARSLSASSDEPRVQSISEDTSPASLTSASSPKANSSSPVATPPISVAKPSVSPAIVMYDAENPFTDSQDILPGLGRPKFHAPQRDGSRPPSASSSPILDSTEGSLMREVEHPDSPSRSRTRSESLDPLLLIFSPSRPSIADEPVSTPQASPPAVIPFSSPPSLSPIPSASRSNRGTEPIRESDTPRRSASPHNHPEDPAIAQALADDHPGRYSLRQRQAKQMAPYRWDKAQYIQTMGHLPEAIVANPRSPRRHRAREENYEDEQTQETQDADAPQRDEWRPRRSRSKSSSPEQIVSPWVGEYLPPMPPDEDDGEVDALRKEARKAGKEARKADRERKTHAPTRRHGRKTLKAFPVRESDDSEDDRRPSRKPPSLRSHDRSNSPNSRRRVSQQSTARRARDGTPGSPTFPAAFGSLSRPVTPVFQHARSLSPPVCNDDVDMEMPRHSSLLPSSHVQRTDPGSPMVISDDESDRASRRSRRTVQPSPERELSREEKKQRKRIRDLGRMYPAFMRDRMMQDGGQAKPRRQRSPTPFSESEDEQPLLPGQTRVRRAENPRDIRDIKGDSESSDDEKSMSDTKDVPINKADESDVEVVPRRKGRVRRYSPSPRRSSDEEVEEILLDGRIDDERIEAYLKEAPLRSSRLQEKDMIDWMLANTAEVGGVPRPRPRARAKATARRSESPPRRSKASISVGGARPQRQTRIAFPKRDRSQGRHQAHSPAPKSASPAPREPRKRGTVHHHHIRLEFVGERPAQKRKRRPQRDQSPHPNAGGVSGDDGPSFQEDEEPPSPPQNVHDIPHPELLRRAARKQKEKEKRARMKMQGIYTLVAPKGNHIIGQLGKTFTLNVADDGFHQALAPKSDKRPQPIRLPTFNIVPTKPRASASSRAHKKQKFIVDDDRPRKVSRPHKTPPMVPESEESMEEMEQDDPPEPPVPEEQNVPLDFGISVSSIKFGLETYTGRGRLAELVDLQELIAELVPAVADGKNCRDAFRPNHFSAHGFDLGPNVTVARFLTFFGKICDRFFEFATGLPEDDEEAMQEWVSVIAVTCRLITWLFIAEEITDEETRALKDAVGGEALRLTSKMREAALAAQSMDSNTFTVCWFAVELSIRAGFRLPADTSIRPPEPNALQEACGLLIEHLVEFGLDRGMEPLISSPDRINIDGSTIAHRAFEMWVGIWIIADKYSDSFSTSTHPLWNTVETTLKARQLTKPISHFEASENVWRAIISLSTISQLWRTDKIHILALRPPLIRRSPTYWGIVLFALHCICLEAVDETVSEESLDTRDQYVKVVVERCCLLWSRWDWQPHDATQVLHRLLDIFRSRKFANLRHEKAEFPDFLRVDDWTLLSRPIHSETTFVLFLKLVHQTLLVNKSKVKKLLSLAIPTGSLPWSKAHPPSIPELSTLFNRLSVIAIAIHIDPEQHEHWLGKAREYVRFKDVDPTTRNAYIRGLMYLSIVMVRRGLPLDKALDWLDEMVTVLLEEYRSQKGRIVVLGLHALVVSVRNVIHAFKGSPPKIPHRYPDPRLILSLGPILRDSDLIKPNNASAHIVPRLIRSFLNIRELAVPKPKRPALPPAVPEQESQDEYGFDLDLIEAFDKTEEEALLKLESEVKAKDESLLPLLEQKICWILWRQLSEHVKHQKLKQCFKTGDPLSNDIALLTGCWVACGNIVIQNKKSSWTSFLLSCDPKSKNWPKLDTFSQRRMDFLVYSNVLKRDPMTYLDLQDKFFTVLFESLASWHTTSEEDYIELLLSIDGSRHPLLLGAVWAANPQKDEPSNIDLLTARLPLLSVVLENLSQCLTDIFHPVDSQNYVRYCIKMFSAMKNVESELDGKALRSYTSWCLQVYKLYQEHPNIMEQERLRQWTDWLERLTVESTNGNARN